PSTRYSSMSKRTGGPAGFAAAGLPELPLAVSLAVSLAASPPCDAAAAGLPAARLAPGSGRARGAAVPRAHRGRQHPAHHDARRAQAPAFVANDTADRASQCPTDIAASLTA